MNEGKRDERKEAEAKVIVVGEWRASISPAGYINIGPTETPSAPYIHIEPEEAEDFIDLLSDLIETYSSSYFYFS